MKPGRLAGLSAYVAEQEFSRFQDVSRRRGDVGISFAPVGKLAALRVLLKDEMIETAREVIAWKRREAQS